MFGMSLTSRADRVAMIWNRNWPTSAPPAPRGCPPCGSSWGRWVVHHRREALGLNAALVVDPELAEVMDSFSILFGVPVWGFAVLWIALAASLTVRTMRGSMPFALTWWSLTPVGAFVTGTTQLAVHTGSPRRSGSRRCSHAVCWPLGCWSGCARRGAVCGALLTTPPPSAPVPARKGLVVQNRGRTMERNDHAGDGA